MISKKNLFKIANKKTQSSELLDKLELVERYHTGIVEESAKKKSSDDPVQTYNQQQYFEPLMNRFAGFHFLIENQIKTNQIRTFSNYYEIFVTYIEALLIPFKRSGLERHLRVEIKCEFVRQKLFFSLLISNLKFSREDIVSRDLKRTLGATGHLLTPFKGKVSHFMKKSPDRRVKAVLVKMELTPLRQHIPRTAPLA